MEFNKGISTLLQDAIDEINPDLHINIGEQITLSNIASIQVMDDAYFQYENKELNLSFTFEKIQVETNRLTLLLDNVLLNIKSHLNIDISNIDYSISNLKLHLDITHLSCEKRKLIGNAINLLYPLIKPIILAGTKSKLEKLINTALKNAAIDNKDVFKMFSDVDKAKSLLGRWPDTQRPRILQGFEGIGQLPLPRLWNTPMVDVDSLPYRTLSDVIQEARTGDLILFSGTVESSMRIKRMTQSPFSHAVMLVKEPELMDGRCLIWQATASEHKGVLRDMKIASGIQLNYVEDVIADYLADAPKAVIVYRHLTQDQQRIQLPQEMRQRLIDYIKSMDGRAYTDHMEMLYLTALYEIANPDDYYCSSLVAETLMTMKILDSTFMHNQYTPRDLSSLQHSAPFLNNFAYHDRCIIRG